MKLNTLAFALAFGVWWGVGLFLMTWWLIATGNGEAGASLIERVYLGYSVTAAGSVIGLIWGFTCGSICGGILAWLYNTLAGLLGTIPKIARHTPR